MSPNKFQELFSIYKCNSLTDEKVKSETEKILVKHTAENQHADVYKTCFNCIDLTSLNETDTEEEIRDMVEKVNNFENHYPATPNVAAICVYPALVSTVKSTLTEPVGIASVAAGFPHSQTFVEAKVAETALCIMEGATEIDIVISVGKFLEGKYEEVYEELTELKSTCRQAHLKVILETGALQSAANIRKAAVLSMQSGADFIKTSTGKIPVAATPEATYIMCHAIKDWYNKTGVKVGYKPAGGISSVEDVVKHYTLVKEILGEAWLNNKLFRIGTSSMANKLLTAIEGKQVSYF